MPTMFAAIINVFMGPYRRQLRLPGFPNGTLRLLLWLPLLALTTGSREALDPDDPELTWGVFSAGMYLKRGSKIVQRRPARLPPGPIAVTHGQVTTVWIASSEGLIEYPLGDVQLGR